MNKQISKLFSVVVLLFAVLVAFTSRWTVFEAETLENNTANRREILEQAKIERGSITASDRTELAVSKPARADTFERNYPTSSLFAHPVGYSFIDLGSSGLERFYNDDLIGERSEFSGVIDQVLGRRRVGDDVATALDVNAQRVATQALAGQAGSVVAVEVETGRVKVMASTPSFDPNQVPKEFSKLRRLEGSPLLNRSTQALYPPGSTFKVLTAVAAIDSGQFTPESVVNGDSGKDVSATPLRNFGDRDFGDIDLKTALTFSVNTAWAQVAEELGRDTMADYMKRFGFYRRPSLDYPKDELVASGEYRDGQLLEPNSRAIDVGRMAIGQDKLQVTPLQMAMVAAAVANQGVLMKPRLAQQIVDKDGRTRNEIKPSKQTRVMSVETAAAVKEMMANVVREGTGTAAALNGVDVAGKTGTAEVDGGSANQPWFIGFAPLDSPKIAVAVTVERSSGQGGTVAAPIAREVLQALL